MKEPQTAAQEHRQLHREKRVTRIRRFERQNDTDATTAAVTAFLPQRTQRELQLEEPFQKHL